MLVLCCSFIQLSCCLCALHVLWVLLQCLFTISLSLCLYSIYILLLGMVAANGFSVCSVSAVRG